MQIELIDTFLDLCDSKSFNKTAEHLSVTQSTVSGRIKSLEAVVGARLFARSRSGTSLTTEGLRFEPHARALRHNWTTAVNATREVGLAGVATRVGIQHDLVSRHIKGLIERFRTILPDSAFMFEADYSGQICTDLVSGAQDIAVLFTPQMQPDLYFERLGDVTYVMVSSTGDTLQSIDRSGYILANYAPVFAQTHAAYLPDLNEVSLSIGQNAGMVDLLTSLSGTAYVLRHSAEQLVVAQDYSLVKDAPLITQPVFAGFHIRNRHRGYYRKLLEILRVQYG